MTDPPRSGVSMRWRRRRMLLALWPPVAGGCATAPPGQASSGIAPVASAFPAEDPGALGLDGTRLDALRARLAGESNVRSVRVLRHDRQVFDYCRSGLPADALHDVRSVTKSVTALLVGIALGAGRLRELDQPIDEWLPEAREPGVDPRVRAITLRHLLTMTSGFQWNEVQEWSRWRWSIGNSLRRALERPMAHAPGTRFLYDSLSAHLLSIVLSRAVGMPAADYAARVLFEPLGIGRFHWPADAQGWSAGGHGLQLGTEAAARLGALVMHEGLWLGRRVVPADFLREALRRQVDGDDPFPPGTGYGYLWWILPMRNGQTMPSASGYSGQWIQVIPSWRMVCVVTADLPWTGPRQTFWVMRDYVAPAVLA